MDLIRSLPRLDWTALQRAMELFWAQGYEGTTLSDLQKAMGGINCAPANKGIEDFLREQRAIREKVIRQRLRQGIADGDLPSSTDVNGLVAFYTGIVDGMAIRARDGASRKALGDIVKWAMAPGTRRSLNSVSIPFDALR